MKKLITASIAMLFGMTGWAGDSAPFLLDTTDFLITAPITYNSSWIGGNPSAEVVISADGTEIKRTAGEGEFIWLPTTVGRHTLTYTTYINGVAQDEVYTATVFKDWKYTVADGKATIVETTQKSGSVTIPSEIDGLPVVGIGGGLFNGCEGLTSITIPDSVYSIGANAFKNCSNLTNVSMPGNFVTRMSEIFPDSYEKLTCVTLIGDIAEISDNFFKDCASLEEIKFSGEIARVGKNAFDGCSSLDITTQNGFRLYKGWCLEYVGADTTTLNIPNGVIGIADGAFEGKTSLKKVTFPDSLRFIGADAFAGCTQLAELSLTDGIVEIGDGAFRDCTWVQNIKMPNTLERIGAAAFANCAYLPNVVCADGLEEIGVGAFSNCWRMTSVSLPASLDSVGRDAFWNCKNLGGVTVPSHVQPLSEMFPASYSALSSIVMAEGETELCEGAFEGCAGVTKIDIPDEVTDIPARAFKNCTSFDRVSLPAGLLTIGDEAFAGCSKVGSLILPESLTSIGAWAFNGWGLLDVVTIPDGVTFIGSGAFAGCTAVRQVRMPSNVATVSATFPDAYTKIVRVTIPDDSTSIISGFLNGCTSITSFNIPLSVTEIGENAFRGCNNLSGITLPDGLKTIGSYAFYGCTLINDLMIPSSVTSIGNNAFGSCAQIRSVVISGDSGALSSLFPNAYQQIVSVTILPGSERLMDRIFAGCKALKNVDIPTSVTEIGESAFENCTTLTSVGIPSGVTVLGKGAFRGCASLAEITLPNGLAVLEDEVFSGCSHLTAITVPESVVEIGSKVFNGCTLLHSVKFVGDAPVVKSDTYGGASSSLATSVPYASIGWDGVETSMALPEYWPAGTAHSILWWNPIRFDVTFDWNYENGETDLIEQVVDTTYQLPEVDPTREGAVFAGWWTAKTDGARITPVLRVMLTTPHTLYAHWRMNEYSVAFDANGGVGTMETMSLTVNEAKTLRLCEFTRLDCDFAGWAIEPEGEVVYRDGAEVVNLTLEHGDTVTLYAIWAPRTWTEGDYLNQPGFSFVGDGNEPWVTDAEISHDGIGSLRSGAIGASAKYPNRTYSTIKTTVVGEGTGSFWWKVHCEETEYGDWFDYAVFTIDGVEIAKIAGDTDWTKVTYSVTGAGEHELCWSFTRDDYDLEDAEWLNAAWLDELVWSPKMVALSFDAGGATGDVPEAIMRQEGATALLPGAGTLVKGTDVFKGWSDGTTLYKPGSEYTFGSEDETLTAVWEEKVWTLAEAADAETLVMTTGGIADWTIDATSGYTNTMSVKSGVVSSGQESWIETKVNGSGKLTFRWKVMGGVYRNQPFAYAKVEVDGAEIALEYLTDDWEEVALTLESDDEHTIRWTYLRTSTRAADGDCAWIDALTWKSFNIVNSSITYENLRGASHSNPETYQEGSVVEFTNPSDVVGYTFAGWTPSKITEDMTGPQIVRANWSANNYTISYNSNGGTGTMDATLATYDSEVIVKENGFIREGYTFKGWALEEDGDVVYAPGQVVMNLTAEIDGVITLYAVWERILIAIDEPVAVENLIYNGLEQIGVVAADGYTLSGETMAIDAGEYTATATLVDGYKWADGSMNDKIITWSIAKATNEWITEPKISVQSWVEGNAAGELTEGVAKFGVVTATINGAAFTALPTEPGSYTIEYTVADTGNYNGLIKSITFEIKMPNPIPTINPNWGYVVTNLGKKKNEVAVVFTNHTEKAMSWTVPVNLENVRFLVVGGGGGGGSAGTGGGGGAGGGGVVTGMIHKLEMDSTISVVVGAGGAEGTRNSAGGLLASAQGGNSTLTIGSVGAITAYGGAKVHKDGEYSGGSGNGSYGAGKAGTATKGKVDLSVEELVYSVESFGNNGGYGYNNKIGGGGGGAYPGDEGRGGSATSSVAGKGGAGLVSDITGEPITYGSGGGGSTSTVGALGGEGAGTGCSNKSAKANQGGGGGGAGKYSSGGKGGSGIVVIRYTIHSYLLPEDAEVFPEVTDDSKVPAALEGSADVKLAANIKTAAEYAAYREWALNLEGVTPEEVKSSLNAWLSYALNTAALIIVAPKEGDVIINAFESAATEGAFEFTVKIDGIMVGENALEANLKRVFDIEGAETLASGGAGFSIDNVEVNTATPESGNVKFSVTPKMENGEKPNSFFFRVKMR